MIGGSLLGTGVSHPRLTGCTWYLYLYVLVPYLVMIQVFHTSYSIATFIWL